MKPSGGGKPALMTEGAKAGEGPDQRRLSDDDALGCPDLTADRGIAAVRQGTNASVPIIRMDVCKGISLI